MAPYVEGLQRKKGRDRIRVFPQDQEELTERLISRSRVDQDRFFLTWKFIIDLHSAEREGFFLLEIVILQDKKAN